MSRIGQQFRGQRDQLAFRTAKGEKTAKADLAIVLSGCRYYGPFQAENDTHTSPGLLSLTGLARRRGLSGLSFLIRELKRRSTTSRHKDRSCSAKHYVGTEDYVRWSGGDLCQN